MARRILRTIIKVTLLSVVVGALLFILDTRFRVLPSSADKYLHAFLPEHHDGHVVTDITYLSCSRFGSCTLPQSEGWTRVEKDLNLGTGWVQRGYLFFKRKLETEFAPTKGEKVVVDIKISRLQPGASEGAGEKSGAMWEQRPGSLWIKRQPKLSSEAITAVEVLFGPDAHEVREGWVLKEGSLNVGEQPRITVRRGQRVVPKRPQVMMGKDHKLKIIQVSDLHLSTGVGHCREPAPPSTAKNCEADPRTLDFLRRILDDEKPDVAVLTGDQINGDTSPDVQTALFKFAEPFITRKIPFATILGNHDDESVMTREQILRLTAQLPYSLSEVGPEMGPIIKDSKGREVREGGAGNYVVEVVAHNRAEHSALTMYFLDSHSYSPDPDVDGYDWIKDYQIDWFKKTATSLKDEHAKYTYIHLNMAFIHIPLPEYRKTGLPMVGGWREGVTAPAHNSGFRQALVDAGVGVVSVGHDHANDFCKLDGLWMCYAGGSGFGGYGGYGDYIRRVRLFEIDAPTGRIKTWKRVEWEDQGKIDMQTIVEGGKVVEQS